MNRSRIIVVLIIIVASFLMLAAAFYFFMPGSLQDAPWKDWITPALGGLIGLLAILFIFFIRTNSTQGYSPHNVAIIGVPGSGKTSLLVTIFQEIFNHRFTGINATLRGESTITRVNEDMMRKEKGLAPKPTTSQTMFAYRADIEAKTGWIRKIFRVEFGDYPGEYSEWLNEANHFMELKESEYFQWCIQADAYMFIVDTARYLLAKDKTDFVADSARAMRESWQLFLDSKYVTAHQLRGKPVLLVFTKMDICNLIDTDHSKRSGIIREKLIQEKAFSKDNNRLLDIESDKYKLLKEELNKKYASLVSYFNTECKYFSVLYTSSYGKINDQFVDVQKVLRHVLPSQLR